MANTKVIENLLKAIIINLKKYFDSIKTKIIECYDVIAEMKGQIPLIKNIDNLPTAIASIPAMDAAKAINRGGELKNYTIFIDFDGTVLFAYTPEEIQALDELPTPYVTHDGLTFDKWNYTLAEVKSFVTEAGWLDVGAIYYPTDGYGQIELDYRGCQYCTPHFRMKLVSSDNLLLDWGDGITEELTAATDFDVTHTYASAGKYLLKYKGKNAAFNGLYVYNNTKANCVGRCVFPTNSARIACPDGGNKPSENTDCNNIQGIGETMIDAIVLPSGVGYADGNYSSGLYNCPKLRSIVSDTDGLWRAYNKQFPSIKLFSLRPRTSLYSGFYDWEKQSFVNARSLFWGKIQNYNGYKMNNPCCERMYLPQGEVVLSTVSWWGSNIGFLKSISVPISCGVTWWNAGVACNMKYMETFPQISLDGKNILPPSDTIWCRQNGGFANNYMIRDYVHPFGNNSYAILANSFENNYSLETITIYGGTKSINADAFLNCYRLKEIHIQTSIVTHEYICTLTNVNAFANCPSDMKIYVPADSVSAYQSATNWATYASQIFAEPE